MDISQNVNQICSACLSCDRGLCFLEDVQLDLNSTDFGLQNTDKVCWECKAILKKISQFKRRVSLAQRILHSPFEVTNIQSLSSITTVNKYAFDDVISSHKLDNEQIPIEYTDEDSLHLEIDIKKESLSDDSNDFDDRLQIDLKCNESALESENEVKLEQVTQTFETHPNERDESSDKKRRKTKFVKKKPKKAKSIKINERGDNDDDEKIKVSTDNTDLAVTERKDYIKCSLTQESLLRLREKERNSHVFRKAVLKCNCCVITFSKEKDYRTHLMNYHHEVSGNFICILCECRFRDKMALEERFDTHSFVYGCVLCRYYSHYSLARMLHHLSVNHSKEYSCSMCKATFNSLGAARYHKKTHNVQECKVCFKTFADLKVHMVSHNEVRTEECPICKKSLKSKSSLRFHLMTHEAPNKDEAYCAECDTQFKNKHIYRSHLKSNAKHNTADKECDYCHKKFISKFTLSKHIMVVHYNKLDHICHLCGKKFSIAGHLRNHIHVYHEGGSKPRKYICNLCGKGFTIKKCLDDHINTHTGARPYKCDKCPAQFGFKSALYMHNRLKHLKGKKGRKNPLPQHSLLKSMLLELPTSH